jgi:hypothetical protein
MRKRIISTVEHYSTVIAGKTRLELFITFLPVFYVLLVSAFMVYQRSWFSHNQFFAIAILSLIFIGKFKQLLSDWIAFFLFLFGYEYLLGLIPMLSKNVNIFAMINADKLLFGFLPTVKVQSLLYSAAHLHWYDYLSVLLYSSHFVVPLAVGFVFWLYDKKHFKHYTQAFLLLSYLVFLTYLLFPAMPPWMASNQGYIPHLQKIMDQVYASFAVPISVPSVYSFFGVNLIAAFPSLHAAYPWLIFLCIQKKSKFWGAISLFYVFGVWFSVIYLGEHYVIDVIAAILYTSFAYFVVQRFSKRRDTAALKVSPGYAVTK